MKTFSEVVKLFDDGNISPNKTFEIEARDLVRMYKAHQRALNEKLALEARIASFEIVERKERIIYG